MKQLNPSTATSAHVCTQASCVALRLDGAFRAAFYHSMVAGALRDARPERRPQFDLDAMCAAATARLQQGILQAAGEAYIALDIPPPDSHVIDVLMSIPGLAGGELTDDARGE
ncbi:hypothetical protein N5K37_13770 [Delftia tsuruhatensis]|uniref:Uncharacterized protein n=1 Tax=Delftia tsuruhatensis TaxID=180282 RepID=A0ABN4SD58_9BURK|nr:hypothetical protein [Delftia tsuruhatensis]AOV01532.1 hypothetical protein BI380_09275 [Delftia tsuruhatensis]MDH2230981.1 hypothetical protein [Delftia tsuruhatensis]